MPRQLTRSPRWNDSWTPCAGHVSSSSLCGVLTTWGLINRCEDDTTYVLQARWVTHWIVRILIFKFHKCPFRCKWPMTSTFHGLSDCCPFSSHQVMMIIMSYICQSTWHVRLTMKFLFSFLINFLNVFTCKQKKIVNLLDLIIQTFILIDFD